jgi:hypothetical protein
LEGWSTFHFKHKMLEGFFWRCPRAEWTSTH